MQSKQFDDYLIRGDSVWAGSILPGVFFALTPALCSESQFDHFLTVGESFMLLFVAWSCPTRSSGT